MVPLGIASAAAVSVGQAVGRGDVQAARRNGYIAIGLGCAFMSCSAIVFLTMPRAILLIYSSDAGVLALGVPLLAMAAAFQLSDGIQTVTTGALRGLGNTRLPMIANLLGYWFFGLPIGYALCFHWNLGVYGLWIGLTLGLTVIAATLLLAWGRSSFHVRDRLLPMRG
jgi:MATE family multidrug resistance protein